MSRRVTQPLLVLLGVFFFVGGVFVYVIAAGGPHEDKRETRNFGGLTCVYNVDTDTVEACE